MHGTGTRCVVLRFAPHGWSSSLMNIREMIASVPHWYHRFEFAAGIVTPGVNDSSAALAQLDLPKDLSGLRVLDIGARDGFFSFECERRGAAEVVAIDYFPPDETGFPVAKQILGSKLNLVHENIYKLTPAKYGTFDIVLCLGVMYHLPDPLGAFDVIYDMMKPKGTLYMETVIIDEQFSSEVAQQPMMVFYPGRSKNNDPTNYWGMTKRCAIDMMAEYEITCVAIRTNGERGTFVAVKSSTEKNYYLYSSRNLVGQP
jgi:tRNA (mo5U34)-methyltransferase